MKIIAIIPARGGSKGLKNKNIADLSGHPLIFYTIREALKIKRFQRIIVSTEDPLIQEVSAQCGLDVPFLRPEDLARDDSRTIDVVIDVLEKAARRYQESFDYVCLLQPTSPLRRAADIEKCLDLISPGEDLSVVSLNQIDEPHPYKMKVIVNGVVESFIAGADSSIPRQTLPSVFALNGAVYIASVNTIMNHRSFFSQRTIPYIMPLERSININHPVDMMLAKILLGKAAEENGK